MGYINILLIYLNQVRSGSPVETGFELGFCISHERPEETRTVVGVFVFLVRKAILYGY